MEVLDEETVHEQFPPRAEVKDIGHSRTNDGEQENARESLHAATLVRDRKAIAAPRVPYDTQRCRGSKTLPDRDSGRRVGSETPGSLSPRIRFHADNKIL